MKPLHYHEVQQVLKMRENYYRGLRTTGSHHDQKVALHGLLIIRIIRKDFEKKFKETK